MRSLRVLILFAGLVPATALAATPAPTVVFTGDYFTVLWQADPSFTANTNWIGAGVEGELGFGNGSGAVAADFQANVINQHPAFVHILTGGSNIAGIIDSTPLGPRWHQYEEAIVTMVQMAKAANIKVIFGNIPSMATDEGSDPQAVQFFNAWLARYGLANNIPVVNYHDALCQCVGSTTAIDTSLAYPGAYSAGDLYYQPTQYPGQDPTPNAAGWELMTKMAQMAIATYDLTIKSGYLSNVVTRPSDDGAGFPSQQNSVLEGTELLFTPQAKWSDGVVRPMLNQDFNGLKGTWTSSNPGVMTVNQQGQAYAYSAGTATISFTSASGIKFSPWVMTVGEMYPPFNL
jgi:Bacterial Ig-like domain (group 2)